ncbi:hypothetical protein [Actinotalea solisilvae]|uniref:hypothetical protein n=1 Tax=Actinotalea solisilvae TaxID=2072922 RepID=UPI0018F13743|nr:hypothetical protein [Actinotalea solisilvae]
MIVRKQPAPPRPLAAGDVVTTYSDALGAWTAAQITDLDVRGKQAGVLELDWSGAEPPTLADLDGVRPLVLTHHAWGGQLSHANFPWLLPRGYRVIGRLPLLHRERSRDYGRGWHLGDQLAHQRRWDAGDRSSHDDPQTLRLSGEEASRVGGVAPRKDIRTLIVVDVDTLDCDVVVAGFPDLRALMLWGRLGLLAHAGSLNRLTGLREVHVDGLFGMAADEVLDPTALPHLEALTLHDVPSEYAAATRRRWRAEVAHGTELSVTGARTPEWVAENRSNPLRGWDGRELISRASYTRSVAQFRRTRQAVLTVLRDVPPDAVSGELARIGHEYGTAFNRLSARTAFIETEEREDLLVALDAVVSEAEAELGRDLTAERVALLDAVDAVRDW